MLYVRTCCCGCTLAQGCIIAAIVSVIEAIACLSAGGFLLANAERRSLFYRNQTTKNDNNTLVFEIDRNYALLHWAKFNGWACVSNGLLIMAVTAMLVIGVSKRRRLYLLPWLVFKVMFFVFGAPTLIYHLAAGMQFLVFIIGLLLFTVYLYLFIIVLSYFKTMTPPVMNDVTLTPIQGNLYNQPGYVFCPGPAPYQQMNATMVKIPPTPSPGQAQPIIGQFPYPPPHTGPPPYEAPV